jgi:Kef-type K+ transport system membrane component KefB
LGVIFLMFLAGLEIDLGEMRKTGRAALLGAAVADDILVLLILSIFLALTAQTGAGWPGVGRVVLRLELYLALAAAGYFVLPRLARWAGHLSIGQGVVSLVVVALLLYSWAAEALGGIATVTDAFLAGLGPLI